MANPVHLVVWQTPLDPDDDKSWVFVHTDPSNATVTSQLANIDTSTAAIPQVTRLGKAAPNPSLPPYYNTVYRIDQMPRDGKAFRLHIIAVDPAGAREETHFSLLFAGQRRLMGGATIAFGSPLQGTAASPSQVSTNGFIVCGYVTPFTNAMSAWLVPQNTNNVIPSTAMKPPRPYDWAFQFGTVPGGLYSLFAEANGDSTTIVCSILNAS